MSLHALTAPKARSGRFAFWSPRMTVTSATRFGKGRGYGGEAKGEGNRDGRIKGGRPRKDVAAVIALQKAGRIEVLKEHLIGLALTAERESDQIPAALGLLKHEDAPTSRVQLSGPDGGPMKTETRVTVNIVRPDADSPGAV